MLSIQSNCPNIRLLNLCGCAQIYSIGSSKLTIELNKLVQLNVDQCLNLSVLCLRAVGIERISANQNPKLAQVKIQSSFYPFMQFNDCPLLDIQDVLKRTSKSALDIDGYDLFNGYLSPLDLVEVAKKIRRIQDWKKSLFFIVVSSKDHPHLAAAASNAISILNLCYISFAGRNFAGVRIPSAYLKGAILARVNFQGADLTGACLEDAITSYTNFDGASMEGVRFGQLPFIRTGSNVTKLLTYSNGQRLIGTCQDGSIRVWDIATGKELACSTKEHSTAINAFTLLDNERRLLSISDDRECFWHLDKMEMYWPNHRDLDRVTSVVSKRAGDEWVIISMHESGKIRLHEGRNSYTIGLEAFIGPHSFAALLHGGLQIASVGLNNNASPHADKIISIWNLPTENWEEGAQAGEPVRILRGHISAVQTLIADTSGLLISVSIDNAIIVWDPSTGEQLHKIDNFSFPFTTMALLERGKKLVWCNENDIINFLELDSNRSIKPLQGHQRPIHSLCTSADHTMIGSSSNDNKICVWKYDSESNDVSLEKSFTPFFTSYFKGNDILVFKNRLALISASSIHFSINDLLSTGHTLAEFDKPEGSVIMRMTFSKKKHSLQSLMSIVLYRYGMWKV